MMRENALDKNERKAIQRERERGKRGPQMENGNRRSHLLRGTKGRREAKKRVFRVKCYHTTHANDTSLSYRYLCSSPINCLAVIPSPMPDMPYHSSTKYSNTKLGTPAVQHALKWRDWRQGG